MNGSRKLQWIAGASNRESCCRRIVRIVVGAVGLGVVLPPVEYETDPVPLDLVS
jgi:hypothetical protein